MDLFKIIYKVCTNVIILMIELFMLFMFVLSMYYSFVMIHEVRTKLLYESLNENFKQFQVKS